MRPDPAGAQAYQKRFKRAREARAKELGRMRCVLVHAFPGRDPQALVLLDVGTRTLDTFLGPAMATAKAKLLDYDIIAAVDVRALLRGLGLDPGERRLAELGPPQKTMQLNHRIEVRFVPPGRRRAARRRMRA